MTKSPKHIIIKNESQIEGITKSCELSADVISWVEQHIKPGITTQELNDIAESFMRKYNAIPAPLGYMGFPKATCISLNDVICHGIPGDQVLVEGDILNVDVSTILNGYYGDTSKMFKVGKVSEEAEKLIAVTSDCLAIGISQVRPGAEFWKIGKAIQDYATSRGYSVVHQFCGHGVGVNFHEPPQVHHDYFEQGRDTRTMEPGMIFTIEPMINCGLAEAVIDENDKWTARTKDGRLSAQFEHTVLVTEVGVDILTK